MARTGTVSDLPDADDQTGQTDDETGGQPPVLGSEPQGREEGREEGRDEREEVTVASPQEGVEVVGRPPRRASRKGGRPPGSARPPAGEKSKEEDRERQAGPGPGRPPGARNKLMTEGTVALINGEKILMAPSPRKLMFEWDEAPEWFEYWKNIDAIFPDRFMVYVYRTWPVMLRPPEPPPPKRGERKVPREVTNIGKLARPTDKATFLRMWGSGDYHLKLNDSRIKRTLAMLDLKLRDDNAMPVLDLRKLDHLDPINAVYINTLRQKGIPLPWEEEAREETRQRNEDEMNAPQMQLVDVVERLVDKATERQVDPSTDVIGKAMLTQQRIFEDTMKSTNEMHLKQAEAQSKQTNASDPSAVVTMISQLAGVLKPPPVPDNSKSMESILTLVGDLQKTITSQQEKHSAQLFQIQAAQIESLRSEVRAGKGAVAADGSLVPAGGGGLRAALHELAELRGELRSLAGDDDEDKEPAKGGTDWGPIIMGGVGILVSGVSAMLYNLAVARTGQGTPMPPAAPPEVAGMPGMPGVASQPQPAGVGDPQKRVQDLFLVVLDKMQEPLLTALKSREFTADPFSCGDEFAETICRAFGYDAYTMLRDQGKQNLYQLIQSHEPVWVNVRHMLPSFESFLDGFLAFNPNAGQGEEEEDGEQGPDLEALPIVTAMPRPQ